MKMGIFKAGFFMKLLPLVKRGGQIFLLRKGNNSEF